MRYKRIADGVIIAVAVSLAACSDDLLGRFGDGSDGGEEDGMVFGLTVREQVDVLYEMGNQTRGGVFVPDSVMVAANTNSAHELEGGEGMQVHKLTLPFVGIHPGAVSGETNRNTSVTRAALSEIVNSDIQDFHDTLAIWGYAYNSSSPYSVVEPYERTLFNNTLLKKVRGWRSSLHWPYDEGKAAYMKFYAISPAIEDQDMRLTNSPSYTTAPEFEFTVAASPGAQRDLLYGVSSAVDVQARARTLGADDKTVSLTFDHILTAVRFAQGKMPEDVTIRRISLKGIKNRGTYNGTSWSGQSGAANYSTYPMHDVTAWNADVYIDGDSVLFLIPHTLTSSEKLEVVLRKDGEDRDRTLTCSLSGDVWAKGHTVTYKVTIGELVDDYYLVIDAGDTGYEKYAPDRDATTSSSKYTQASGVVEYNSSVAGNLTVHSFRNYKDYSSTSDGTGTNRWHGVGWKVVGFADAVDGDYALGNTSAGYVSTMKIADTSIKEGSEQEGLSQTVTYTMAEQVAVYSGNHATILSGNNTVSNFNLSTRFPNGSSGVGDEMYEGFGGPIYNSANSYIVNAQGSYRFPMVYGNSYQNGVASISNPGGIFVDHAGNAIASASVRTQVNSQTPTVTEEVVSNPSDEYSAGIRKIVKTARDSYGEYTGTDLYPEIVWQDSPGLYTELSIPADGFIGFTVGAGICPSNCLIALKGNRRERAVYRAYSDEDKTIEFEGTAGGRTYSASEPPVEYSSVLSTDILWMWHIWCTDEVYPNAGDIDKYYPQYSNGSKIVQLDNDGTANDKSVLPVNLGWVPDNMAWRKYEPREVWVKIQQSEPEEGAQTAYIRLRKEASRDLITGTSTVYQWGRPTAIPMVNTVAGADRYVQAMYLGVLTTLNASQTDELFCGEKVTSPEQFLQNPTKLLRGTNSNTRWWETGTPAYWSSTKTLYDPCPPGYQLPKGEIFKVMSLTGDNIPDKEDGEKINIWDSNSGAKGMGAYVYATAHSTTIPEADRYGSVFYFPSSGDYSGTNETKVMRKGNASTSYGNTDMGYSWTYGISTDQLGYAVQFVPAKQTTTSGVFYYNQGINHSYAIPVRPMGQ